MIRIQERQTVKLPGITSLFVSFDFKQEIVDELKLLKTSIYNPQTKEWEIPIVYLAEFIDRVCKIDSIKLNVLADEPDCEQLLLPSCNYKTTPFPYQQEGITYGINHDRWLLLDAPGLGKTLQACYIAQELKEQRGLQHCLIICGINSLKTNWKTEIEKHSNLTCRILGQRYNRKGQLVVDGIDKRLEQLKAPIEEFFIITNIETLRNEKIVKALLSDKYNRIDMIVVDEIHKCKSNQSTQGKNLLKLNKAKYRIGATGTLLLNNPFDAFVPLKWIGVERSNFTEFRYFYGNYGGPFNNMLIGFKNLSILQDQIKRYSLRRTKDILDLPPRNIITEYVDMSPVQSEFYTAIEEGVGQSVVDKVKLSNANLLALVARLRQATACPSILTTNDIPSAKIERAVDLVEQLVSSGEKVVIFSTFKETVYKLKQLLNNYNVVIATGDQTDQEYEDAKISFQTDPDVNVFIGTWQKGGTGITLNAASYMIHIDTPWTFGEFEQVCDRIHRIGTHKPVFIYNLITKDTIDERVLELINDKAAISEYIVDEHISPQGLDSLRKYIEQLV